MQPLFVKFKDILQNYGLEWFKKYYGVYLATCVSNADPDNLARIRVNCPQLYGKDNEPGHWVLPRNQVTGTQAGIYWVPQEGDQVLITCINGDARYPMWEWANWLSGQAPSNVTPGKQSFVTPGGHRIDLDDNSEEIIITDIAGHTLTMDSDGIDLDVAGGHKIHIDDTSDSILIETQAGFEVRVDNDGIYVGGSAQNLGSLLTDILTQLELATVGPTGGPLLNAAAFTALKATVSLFMKTS